MIGKYIGPYEAVRRLGQGGMGAVFEALAPGGERVAIKVLFPEHAKDPDIAARFFNEARAVNRIASDGTVRVYDHGVTREDLPYLVMEFLEGQSLTDRIYGDERPSVADALRLTAELADTLAIAHSRGIVHRDLKPDNVMIVADPATASGERVKILDFGIAKIAGPGSSSGSWPAPKTQVGQLMGTPVYMAPEQCRGAEFVTDRTDVYALGIIFYQLLSGQLPYVANTVADMLQMHMYKEAAPLGDHCPGAPEAIVQMVHAMLSKDPTVRPAMHTVAARLTGRPDRGADQGAQVIATVPAESALSARVAGQVMPVAPDGNIGENDVTRVDMPRLVPPTRRSRLTAAVVGALVGVAAVLAIEAYWSRTENGTVRISSVASPAAGTTTPGTQVAGTQPAPALAPIAGTQPAPAEAPAGTSTATEAARPSPSETVDGAADGRQRSEAGPGTGRKIHWTLESTPAGAQVIQVADQQVLGETPWQVELPADEGAMAVLLRRPGYLDRPVALGLSEDEHRVIRLLPRHHRLAQKDRPSPATGGERPGTPAVPRG